MYANRWHSIYQPNKRKKMNCNPTICWNDLLSNDNEYMTTEYIHNICVCTNKNLCITISMKLERGMYEESAELLSQLEKK